VRLIQEEHQLGAVLVSHLGKLLVELREQVHEERGEEFRPSGHAGQFQQREDAAAVRRGLDEIHHVEFRLAEEDVGSGFGEGHEFAQQHACRG
jgi:hypothetical protein